MYIWIFGPQIQIWAQTGCSGSRWLWSRISFWQTVMNKRPGIVIANSLRANFEFLMIFKFLLIGLPQSVYSQLSLFQHEVSLKTFFLFWSFNVRTSDIQLTLKRWQLGSNHFVWDEICAKSIVIELPCVGSRKENVFSQGCLLPFRYFPFSSIFMGRLIFCWENVLLTMLSIRNYRFELNTLNNGNQLCWVLGLSLSTIKCTVQLHQ